ncbi:MAG: hypothetical protein ACYTEQ_00750 [Planctomycetota bacterium]
MRKTILVGLMLVLLTVLSVRAGYEHIVNGRTSWTARPTAVTAWLRERNRSVLWPARKVQVFHDSIRHFNYALVGSITNHPLNLGYWEFDSNGILFPNDDLEMIPTSAINVQGGWTDVEWYIDDDGIMWPKS